MDIPRTSAMASRKRKNLILVTVLVLSAGAVTLGLARLKPAAAGVERSTIWTDTVKRGEMLRQVGGIGTLVPEEIRWIPAETEARVERINVLPGTRVEA